MRFRIYAFTVSVFIVFLEFSDLAAFSQIRQFRQEYVHVEKKYLNDIVLEYIIFAC